MTELPSPSAPSPPPPPNRPSSATPAPAPASPPPASRTPVAPSRRAALRAGAAGGVLLGFGLAGCRWAVSTVSASGAAGPPRRGGTVSVAVNSDFTPSLLYSQAQQSLQNRLLYNTLVRYDDDLVPHPELATSWTYAPDGRAITLRLRDDVTYHDGRPFTADDVIFAVRNLQKPVRAAQLRTTAAAVTGFEKRGDHELVLKLAHPVGNLFDLFEFMIITDRHTVDQALAGKKLNGTGPFRLKKWSPGARMTLLRNDAYFKRGRPYLDGVEVRVIPQSDALLSSLRSGQTHLSYNVPGKSLGIVESNPGLVIKDILTGSGATYLGVNTTVEPLNDKTIRQALAYAVDRERILKQTYGGYGMASAAPWPRSSPAYTEANRTHYTHDPGKARALLKSAGVSRLRMPMLHLSLPDEQAVAESIQYDLKQVGVDVTLQPTDPAIAQKDLISQNMPGLWTMGHAFAQVTPCTLAVSAYPFNEAKNTSKFHSAKYTEIVREAWTTPVTGSGKGAGAARVHALAQRISDVLLDEAFLIDLVVRGNPQVTSSRLHGVALNKFSYLDLDDAYLV